jgi:hypothetical protein
VQEQPSQVPGEEDRRLERAIILQVLRDDHEHRWSRSELELETADVEPLDISDALARLAADGIVRVAGESVWASRALGRLDDLGLIAI